MDYYKMGQRECERYSTWISGYDDRTIASNSVYEPMLKLEQFCKENSIEWDISIETGVCARTLHFIHKPSGKHYKNTITNDVWNKVSRSDLEEHIINLLKNNFDLDIDDPRIKYFPKVVAYCDRNGIEFTHMRNMLMPNIFKLYFKDKVTGKRGYISVNITNLLFSSQEAIIRKLKLSFNEKENTIMPQRSTWVRYLPSIKEVIFNDPATIILWLDGSKTVVKCQEGDIYDPEKGMAMAICKKVLGTNESKSNFNDIFNKWIPEKEEEPSIAEKICDAFRNAMNPPDESGRRSKLICKEFTVKDYADANDISTKTVYNMVKSGELTTRREGRRIYILEKGDNNG